MKSIQKSSGDKIQIIYNPESLLRRPSLLFRNMIRDLIASRHLAWRLIVRNLNAMYRQTILGYVWAFLPPLAVTVVWVFLKSQKIFATGPTEVPYVLYVLTGTLLWQGFTDALNAPLRLLQSSKAMLTKINFPREALILAALGEVIFNFIVRSVLLIILFFVYDIQLTAYTALAPVGIIAILTLGITMGILILPFGLLYQDVGRGLTVITTFWFLVTPVVYPPPTAWPASLIVQFNPVSPLIVATRNLLTTGQTSLVLTSAVIFSATFFLLCLGWIIYHLSLPHLIARMSA